MISLSIERLHSLNLRREPAKGITQGQGWPTAVYARQWRWAADLHPEAIERILAYIFLKTSDTATSLGDMIIRPDTDIWCTETIGESHACAAAASARYRGFCLVP